MQVLDYDITAQVPLGERHGRLHLEEQDGVCKGEMELMRFHNAVSGTIGRDGACCLKGMLKTLVREYAFTAQGFCGEREADLTFQWGRLHVHVQGERTVESHG